MANPIIKIKRGATAPVATLNAGEFAIDQVAKNLYLGVEVGGSVTNEIVGGEGTFATKAYVTTALGGVSGTLGNMAVQNKETINITGGSLGNSADDLFIHGAEMTNASLENGLIDSTPIGATTPSTGAFTTLSATDLSGTIDATNAVINFSSLNDAILEGAVIRNASSVDDSPIGATTPSTGAFTTLTASSAPSASNDVVRKTDLESAISALGSVFHYVGNVSLATTPFDLGTLPDQNTGAYYRVDVAGTYVDAGYPDVEAKVGDAFIFTATNGFQKLDNVDAVVTDVSGETVVTGTEDTGYTVGLAPAFVTRMDEVETKTQNIDLTGTTAGETIVTGVIKSASNRTGIDFVNSSIYAYDGTSEFKVLVVYDDLEVGKDVFIGTDPTGGSLTVTGNSTLTGNLSVTGNITDAVIDGGSY